MFSQGLLLVFVWKVGEDGLSLRQIINKERYEKGGNDDGTDLLGGFERKSLAFLYYPKLF